MAILQNSEPAEAAGYEKRDEIPYDFERRRLSIVVERQSQRLLITKGAPEGILARSVNYESDGHTAPLDAAALGRCQTTYEGLSRQGFRVLAVAYTEVEARADYSADDERDLILAGFWPFPTRLCRMPPRPWPRCGGTEWK